MLCVAVSVCAQSERQTRKVHLDRVFDCSAERTDAVVDMFIYALQTDINSLFSWAFLGTGDQGDPKGKDAVSIHYTGNEYDPETRSGKLFFNINVFGRPWFKNRELGSVCSDSIVDGTRYLRLDITYSGALLQAADGLFHTTAIDAEHTRVHFEINVILGRFFSAFVTNKMWKDVAVWRIEKMIDNIKEFAETGTVTARENEK